MKIKQSSWHYRAIEYFNIEHSNSLCCYFWQTLFAILFLPVCIGTFFIAVAMVLLLASIGLVTLPLEVLGVISLVDSSLRITSIFGLFAYGAALFYVFEKGKKAFFRYLRDADEEAPINESLFVAYIKAKKRKVCPIIEYTK